MDVLELKESIVVLTNQLGYDRLDILFNCGLSTECLILVIVYFLFYPEQQAQ